MPFTKVGPVALKITPVVDTQPPLSSVSALSSTDTDSDAGELGGAITWDEEILHLAAEDLLHTIRTELKCAIAKDKTAVIASSDSLALKLAKKLSCHGAVAAPATASLGVDLTCGRKRSEHKSSGVRQSRLAKGHCLALLCHVALRTFESAAARWPPSAGR